MLPISNEQLQQLYKKFIEWLLDFGPRLIFSIIILYVGIKLIRLLITLINKAFIKAGLDPTLKPFLSGIISWSMKIFLFIGVAALLGIETTSFVTILGAAGLAIGLALQGTLSNLAGGVLCLIFKPYKVGDFIQIQGEIGDVKEIQIFSTMLISPENKTVTIPNGAIMNGNITNFTKQGKRRITLSIGIAYNSNVKLAKAALLEVLENHPMVLKDPTPFVGVLEYADSAIILTVRPYVLPDHYWDIYFEINEQLKEALDKANITIPFPQRDVHIINESKS